MTSDPGGGGLRFEPEFLEVDHRVCYRRFRLTGECGDGFNRDVSGLVGNYAAHADRNGNGGCAFENDVVSSKGLKT